MHYGRILAVVGVVVAFVGFLLKSASSAGADVMPALHQANEAIPEVFNNTWTALYNDTNWAAIVFALAGIAAVAVAVIPPMDKPMARLYGLAASVLGVVMLAISIVSTLGAMDDADSLQAAFAQAAAGGAIPEAYTVTIGFGWYLLILGGALVGIGGVVSLIARPDEDAIT